MGLSKAFVSVVVCALLLLSSVGLYGAAGGARAEDEVPIGGTLRIGWMQEQDTLNIFVTNTVQGRMIIKFLYDSLLMWNKTIEPAPQLAESFTKSADGLTYTYTLVEGAKWSDGQAVKASDVKFTFDLIKENQLSVFYDQVKYMSSVTVNGDREVTVVYSTTVGTVLSDMCLVPIIPEHVWTGMTKDEILVSTNSAPVGSGPWRLTSWDKQSSVVFDVNEDYWGGRPYLDRVVFQYFSNSEAMLNALKNGEIDIIPKELPASALSVLNQRTDIKVTSETDLYYREISINCNADGGGNPTLRDVKVRQALAMATDKNALVDLVHLGYASQGSTIVQKAASYWWDSEIEQFAFDIPAANALLNASGYIDTDLDGIRESPDETEEMSYTLLVLSRWPEEMRTGQQLQTWWAQIGVELIVQSADANTINSFVYPDYNQDMFLWGYSGQPDPNFSLLIMLSSQVGDWNDCGYRNASYDALYDQQAMATDPEERRDIIHQMQEIIYRDSPYLVLYYMPALGAYRLDKFTGFVNMPTGLLSNVNTFTLKEVHLLEGEAGTAAADYIPWIIALVAIIVAVAAIVFVVMRGRKGKAEPQPEPPAEPKD